MRTKVLAVLLTLTLFPHISYCKNEVKIDEGQIIAARYVKFRNQIIEKTFNVFEYNNDTILQRFKDGEYFGKVYEDLKKKSNADRKMVDCLGNMPSFSNIDHQQCFKKITEYLQQVKGGCQEKRKDTSWVKEVEDSIKDFHEECVEWFNCKEKKEYSNYKSKYKKGCFTKLIPPDGATPSPSVDEEGTNGTQGETATEGVQGATGAQDDQDTTGTQGNQDTTDTDGTKGDETTIVLISIIVLVLLGGGYAYYRIKRSKTIRSRENNHTQKMSPQSNPTIVVPKEPTKKEPAEDEYLPKPLPDMVTDDGGKKSEPHAPVVEKEWIVVGASVKGNGHIQSNMPCQDNHKFESIGKGWGIAIVSDGAGSAAHSEMGSKVVVKRGLVHFKDLIEKEGWMKDNVLPTDVEWLQKSYYVLKAIRDDVEMVSKKNNVEIKSLSATCLAVIYSPIGLLAVHVGDGRMGYKSASGEWHAMMTPHKGEEANQTIFLISDFWSIPNYVMSGVLVPESKVVRTPVKAFALMSDGCENTAWKCTALNPNTGKYYDQNKPFEGFFNPLEETLLSLDSEEERQAKWYKFIESGATGFVKEQDDKTMIYGVFVNN